MKTVAFVPIKLNNERFPGKNVKPFTGGKPLIAYILDTLLAVENCDEKYVYCSSEEICEYLPEGIKFLKRDPYYDLSSTPFNEVLTSFAKLVEADVYVLTHATAPFMSAQSISLGIDKVASGEVKPTIYKILPITEAEEAHAILYRGENVGKVVLHVAD